MRNLGRPGKFVKFRLTAASNAKLLGVILKKIYIFFVCQHDLCSWQTDNKTSAGSEVWTFEGYSRT